MGAAERGASSRRVISLAALAAPAKGSRLRAGLLLILLTVAGVAGAAAALPAAPQPMVFWDELHYVQMARDVAAGGWPRYNRRWTTSLPPLYGAALAPARALAGREAFPWWARFTNAVLMSLAALPAYRLARLLLSRPAALLAAAVALLGPYRVLILYTMSENLLVLLVLTVAVVLAAYVRRPTWSRALGVGLLLGLCLLTKWLSLVFFPGVVLAAAAARRSWRDTLRLAVAAGGVSALLAAAWFYRGIYAPGEAKLLPFPFDYGRYILSPGLQATDHYFYWFRLEAGVFLVGPGTPFLATAILAVRRAARNTAPASRALAVFAAVTAVIEWGQVSFWAAQISTHEPYRAAYTWIFGRYFAPLWALAAVLGVAGLRRTRHRAAAATVAAVAALAFLVPEPFFTPSSPWAGHGNFPGTWQIANLRSATTSPLQARLLLVALTLPVLLLGRTTRAAAALLLLFGALVQYWGLDRGWRAVSNGQRGLAQRYAPLLRRLAAVRRPQDLFVCRIPSPESLDYRIPYFLETDYAALRWDWSAPPASRLWLDRVHGRFFWPGGRPRGRVFLVTDRPELGHGPPHLVVGRVRLYAFDGVPPLAAIGVYPDLTCQQHVVLAFRLPPGDPYECGLALAHPGGPGLPQRIAVRVGGKTVRLAAGRPAFLALKLGRGPRYRCVWLAGSHATTRGGRQLSFRLRGLYVRPAPPRP